jgi:hypothetical protein
MSRFCAAAGAGPRAVLTSLLKDGTLSAGIESAYA